MSVSAPNGSIPARMLEVWLRQHVRTWLFIGSIENEHRKDQSRDRRYAGTKKETACRTPVDRGMETVPQRGKALLAGRPEKAGLAPAGAADRPDAGGDPAGGHAEQPGWRDDL